MAGGSTIGTGMALLTFGFIVAFVGFVGWQDPENFAVMNSRFMREADNDGQRVYGRLVAGCIGCAGVVGMLFGFYLILTQLLQ